MAFASIANNIDRPFAAHHYLDNTNEYFFYYVIYDGNEAGVRLIGIEYM